MAAWISQSEPSHNLTDYLHICSCLKPEPAAFSMFWYQVHYLQMVYRVRSQAPPQFPPHKISISVKQLKIILPRGCSNLTQHIWAIDSPSDLPLKFCIFSQSSLLEANGTEELGQEFIPKEDLPHTRSQRMLGKESNTEPKLLSSRARLQWRFESPLVNGVLLKEAKQWCPRTLLVIFSTLIHSHSSENVPASWTAGCLTSSCSARPGSTDAPLPLPPLRSEAAASPGPGIWASICGIPWPVVLILSPASSRWDVFTSCVVLTPTWFACRYLPSRSMR